jgi:hypothetical protein
MANVLWKFVLASTREKVVGSVGSGVQVIVTEPPDVGLVEVTAKFDNAEAKGRKKRTRLNRKREKEKQMCNDRRLNTVPEGGMH